VGIQVLLLEFQTRRCEQFLIFWQVERCRWRSFGKQCVKGYGEDLFAEAKLWRLGNISLIVSNCEHFFRK